MSQKVFVNRILNMKKIKYIGLDMDHTLIRYHTKNFESLVYELVIKRLVEDKHYPDVIKTLVFDFDIAIRGLIIDSKKGNSLKLSRYGAIRQSYHGTKPIDYDEQKKIYRSVYVDLKDPNYMVIDTSFSIAFCVLFSQLVDLKDIHPDAFPTYAEMALDVLNCVDKVHADGSLKKIISDDLKHYVLKDQSVVKGLQHFIKHGKKIFILTNSDYFYSKLLLDYAINPFLEADQTWKDLFQYVITLASKPRFFYDNPKFLAINSDNGTMTNYYGKIVPGVYQGGCARKFTEDLAISGEEILYIGDHIYGDILRLKKDCNWRTALVVEELGNEIASQHKALPLEKSIIAAMDTKAYLEETYIKAFTKHIDDGIKELTPDLRAYQQDIAAIDAQIAQLLQQQQAFYNPIWGRVFRAGAEESYFAYQVDRFACIYMEKLSDLLSHSPLTYFRANRRVLAHDIE